MARGTERGRAPSHDRNHDSIAGGGRGLVCWHTMKRTTVKLPDDLDLKLRREAERRGVTVSELTREAIDSHLSPRPSRRLGQPGGSGRSDISHRIEEILRSEFAAR